MRIFIFSIFILSLLYLAINPQLHSQFTNPGSITWERLYHGSTTNPLYSGGFDVCEADSGNFYLTGYTRPTPTSSDRPWVIKINPYGDTIWTRVIGSNQRIAWACASSSDGGCVITGDGSTPWTAKVDRDGNINWLKTYPGFFTQAYSMIRTSDGGYAACGRTSYDSAIVFKIDSLGELVWMKVFGSGYMKDFQDIIETDYQYILTGNVEEYSQDTLRPSITKLDKNGDLLWEKKYSIIRGASGKSINITDGQYLIGGTTTDSAFTRSQGYFMRTDTSGALLFTKIFFTEYFEPLRDVRVINENKYIIASLKDIGLKLYGKAFIVDSTGNILTETVFPTPDFMELRAVHPISNGDIIFTGVADFDSILTRVRVYAVRTDSSLNYNPLSINSNYNIVPSGFKIYPAYPNPFNPVTQLKFDISKKGNVKIKIYDLRGREISEILNEELLIGQHIIKWNASLQSSGVYFAVLYFENKLIQSQKMILIR